MNRACGLLARSPICNFSRSGQQAATKSTVAASTSYLYALPVALSGKAVGAPGEWDDYSLWVGTFAARGTTCWEETEQREFKEFGLEFRQAGMGGRVLRRFDEPTRSAFHNKVRLFARLTAAHVACVPPTFFTPSEARKAMAASAPGTVWFYKKAKGSRGRGVFPITSLEQLPAEELAEAEAAATAAASAAAATDAGSGNMGSRSKGGAEDAGHLTAPVSASTATAASAAPLSAVPLSVGASAASGGSSGADCVVKTSPGGAAGGISIGIGGGVGIGSGGGGGGIFQQSVPRMALWQGGRKFDLRVLVVMGPGRRAWLHRTLYVRVATAPLVPAAAAATPGATAAAAANSRASSSGTAPSTAESASLQTQQRGPQQGDGQAGRQQQQHQLQQPAGQEQDLSRAAQCTNISQGGAVLAVQGPSELPGYDVVLANLCSATHSVVSAMYDALPNDGAIHYFGFDYMLDEQLSPWLLEVNSTPRLVNCNRTGAVHEALLEMLCDIVEPCLDGRPVAAGSAGGWIQVHP